MANGAIHANGVTYSYTLCDIVSYTEKNTLGRDMVDLEPANMQSGPSCAVIYCQKGYITVPGAGHVHYASGVAIPVSRIIVPAGNHAAWILGKWEVGKTIAFTQTRTLTHHDSNWVLPQSDVCDCTLSAGHETWCHKWEAY